MHYSNWLIHAQLCDNADHVPSRRALVLLRDIVRLI